MIEGSNYWELYTYQMTEEQKAKLIRQLETKQREREREADR